MRDPGPGDIAVAYKPGEFISVAEIADAVPVFMRLAQHVASRVADVPGL